MFAVYVIFPIFQSFRISCIKWDGLGTLATHGDYVGLANYEKASHPRPSLSTLRFGTI